jgi:hypothetical protein
MNIVSLGHGACYTKSMLWMRSVDLYGHQHPRRRRFNEPGMKLNKMQDKSKFVSVIIYLNTMR